MKISLKLLLGFGFTLFIILILTSTFIYQKKKIENNTTWVFHTSEVLQNSEEIQKMVSDMETGMRGYLLTGKKDFLDPYTRANQRMEERVSNLNGMIKDNPVQKKRLDEFKRVLALWNNTFAMPLIAAKSDSGIEGRKKYDYMFHEHVMKSRGKIYTDKLRAVMNDFVNEEVSLQKKRTANLQESLNNANYLVIMLAVIALLATSGIGYLITRSIKRRISEMVDYSVGIASGNFTDRIKDTSHDEMKMLSESLNQMSERLEVAFDNLKRTNQELDQFAYIVSHDLKAPLRAFSSVINWLEEDLGGRIDNDIQQHFTTLKSRISRMEGLINGLLEYSRIGRQKTEKEKVNVTLILQELKENYVSDPKVQIILQNEYPQITGQKLRIKQVFQNLIDNAVKYGNQENNIIEVFSRDAGDFVQFVVKDNGPGIEKEYHEKIFAIFQTLQPRDKVESTGIGLSIVKKIAEENGGTVSVDSALGKGSSFIVSLPRK